MRDLNSRSLDNKLHVIEIKSENFRQTQNSHKLLALTPNGKRLYRQTIIFVILIQISKLVAG